MVYDFIAKGDAVRRDLTPTSILDHRGKREDILRRHLLVVSRAHRDGLRGLHTLAPHLLKIISDPRTLRLAWDFLAKRGGHSPGEDGRRYGDFRDSEVWDLCRCLGQAIRHGTYNRGPDRIVRSSKGPGRGPRVLVISHIADRVVERAVVMILTPILDPLFDDRSFGFRPGRGYHDALAMAERLMIDQRRRVWLIDDLKDAFHHVPLKRLLQLVRKFLPADDLMGLIGRIVSGGEMPGLRQGGPLSPLMLNVYLNHFLDRPWRRKNPDLPLLRFADDILVACTTEPQAGSAREDLVRLMLPAAMPLKGTPETTIHHLDPQDPTHWLGFAMTKPPRGLAIRIGRRSWDALDDQLSLAHSKTDSPLRAVQVIQGWLGQRGPCYQSSDRTDVCRRIRAIAIGHAFDELPGSADLLALWASAGRKWCNARTEACTELRRTDSSPLRSPTRSAESLFDPMYSFFET